MEEGGGEGEYALQEGSGDGGIGKVDETRGAEG